MHSYVPSNLLQRPLDIPVDKYVVFGLLVAGVALTGAGSALAEGFQVGGTSDFVGGSSEDMYIYTTKDLAVDLASPLVAYKVVTLALKQENPKWLDAIILMFTLGAAWVVVTDVTVFDAYLA